MFLPYREIGAVDGSWAVSESYGKKSLEGKTLVWRTGSWADQRNMKVNSQAIGI